MKKRTVKKDIMSSHVLSVLKRAELLANEARDSALEPEHLLAALLQEDGSLAYDILDKHGLVRSSNAAPRQLALISEQTTALPLSPASQGVLLHAIKLAARHRHWYVGTEHLLASILELHLPAGLSDLLRQANVKESRLKEHLKSIMKSTSKLSDLLSPFADDETRALESTQQHLPALESFGIELTAPERVATMHPFIGREEELITVMSILIRRLKNNPLLVGDPGVGKTALVEGLAQRIFRGDVPAPLAGKRVFTLDLGQMVSGAIYRGEFEARLKQLLHELEHHPEIIVFIDEVHVLVGAGAASGSLDAANLLKPALARGDIRCIGATTYQEYKQHIEHDPALARRFQVININQPSAADTIKLVNSVAPFYETYHHLHFTPDALDSAVTLTERYLPQRSFPDKALDLLDETAARVRLRQEQPRQQLKRQQLMTRLQTISRDKLAAFKRDDFREALLAREHENAVQSAIARLKTNKIHAPLQVTARDIAVTLAQRTGIPWSIMPEDERLRLARLAERLQKQVIGQTAAVTAVSETIVRAAAQLHDPHRPLASLLLLGPSGVGKTLLAKELARELFGSTDALLRFNMSEFSERFTVSTLVGAPAGYVGYDKGGTLTEWVKHHPHSIILFDEFEKAHPEVWNLFLQILDDGRLRDAAGGWIDFRQTVLVFTSNVGRELFTAAADWGFADRRTNPINDWSAADREVRVILANTFPQELLNRLNQIVSFQPLTAAALKKILSRELALINQRLAPQHAHIIVNPSAQKHIITASYSPTEGARHLQRTLLEAIERPISQKLLRHPTGTEQVFRLTVKKGALVLE